MHVAAERATTPGALALMKGEPEGLRVSGCTAGGEERARLRGGDGVAGESESYMSSMSIYTDCSIG